ncbi:Ig-like domain-containing protein [Alsobacter ponti]|uniref:Ig-like domain-containing protein n=1 Tax=Alsobacter ponti TaxID=2962936 RepID=UPI00273A6903|nr:Ig-like domain-containing protein [Alsobacter ponti]
MRIEGSGSAGQVNASSAKPDASLSDRIMLAQAAKSQAGGKPEDEFVLPPPDKIIKVTPIPAGGGIESLAYKLPPDAAIDNIKIVEIDGEKMLVLVQGNGTVLVLEGMGDLSSGLVTLPDLIVGDIQIPQQALEAAFLNSGIQPAAGPGAQASSGGNFEVPPGDIGPGLEISPLLPPTELSFEPTQPEIVSPPDLFPSVSVPGLGVAETTVYEAGLPGRVVNGQTEPEGSDAASNSEATSGLITYTQGNAPATVTINGVVITGAIGQSITLPEGTLTIISYAPGKIGYSFTLTDNTSGDNTTVSLPVVVTDADGDKASANLVITIVDDAPVAHNDVDQLALGETSQSGNVVSGAGTVSPATGADTVGADNARVTEVKIGDTVVAVPASGTVVIDGLYGQLTIAANGDYTYVRAANTPGGNQDVFTYTLTDSDGDPSQATLTIEIPNSVPTVDSAVANLSDAAGDNHVAGGNADAFVPQSTSGSLNINFGFDGPGSPAFQVSYNGGLGAATTTSTAGVTTIAANDGSWTLTINETTGAYTFTQNTAYQHDADTSTDGAIVTVTVKDTDGSTQSGTLTLNIADDTPVAANDAATATEGGPAVTGSVLANDDLGADHGTVGTDGRVTGVSFGATTNSIAVGGSTVIAGAHGTLTLNADGSYSYTPNGSVNAGVTDVFTYTVTDKDGDPATATLTVTFQGDNNLPTLVSASATLSDVAGDDMIAGSNTDPFVPQSTSGTLAFNFGGDGAGTPAFQVSYNGGLGAATTSSTAGVTTIAANDGSWKVTINETTGAYTFTQLTAYQHDAGANTDGAIVTVTLKDSDGSTQSGTLTLTINDDVVAANNDTNTATEGGPAVTGNVLGNDDLGADHGTVGTDGRVTGVSAGAGPVVAIDPNGSTVIAGAHGTLTLHADGSYSYVPNGSANSGVTDTFTYAITDKDGDTDTASLVITFQGDNNVPTITSQTASLSDVSGDNNIAGSNADAFVQQSTSGSLNIGFGGDGAGSPSFQVSYNGGLGAATTTSTAGVTTIAANDGSWKVTINQTTGEYTFTQLTAYQHDAGATTDGGVVTVTVRDSDGSTQSGTLTLNIADDTPTATNDAASATEGGPAVTGSVLANDDLGADHGTVGTDGRVTNVSFGATTNAITAGGSTIIAGAHGTLTLNADGSYSYTPASSANAGVTDVFTYTVTDKDGDTATATLTVTFTGDNSVPTLVSASATLSDVAGDDMIAGSNTDPFVPQSTSGTLNFNFGGDGPGTPAFQVSYNGGLGAATTTSSAGTTTISANDGSWTLTITEATGAYTFTQNTAYQHDAGANTDGAIVTVTLKDSDGSTQSGTLTLTINDDVVAANNDTNTATEGGPAVTGNVLGNDDLGADHGTVGTDGRVTGVSAGAGPVVAIDPNGSTVIAGAHGTLTLHADGSYSYVPNGSANSGVTDTFTYAITDKDGDTDTASLVITFQGDNNVPTITSQTANLSDVSGDNNVAGSNADAFVQQSTSGSLGIGFGGDGPGAPSFQVSYNGGLGAATTTSTAGVTTIAANDGSWKVTINQTTGEYTFTQLTAYQHDAGATTDGGVVTVTVRDSDGSTQSGTLTLNIADDTPTATNDAASATEGGPAVTGSVLANDDLGADHGTVGTDGRVTNVSFGATTNTITAGGSTIIAGAHGTLTLNADGSYSYTPASSANAGVTDVFTYTVTDKDGDTATATLTVTFTGDNSVPTITSQTANLSDVSGDNNIAGSNADAFVQQSTSGSMGINFGGDGAGTPAFQASYDGGLGAATTTSASGVTTITANDGSWKVTINETTGAYTFTQLTAYQHDAGATTDGGVVTVTVKDGDGSTQSATLTLNIADDTPTAANDTGSATEGGSAVTGNVLGNDDLGADHGTVGTDGRVTNVSFGATNNTIAANGSTVINGAYGTLTLNADGSYSYAPKSNISNASPVQDVFTYTVKDKDGDTATATLTITVSDGPNPSCSGSVSLTVNEAALAFGSNPPLTTEQATSGAGNQLTFTAGSDNIVSIGFANPNDAGNSITVNGLASGYSISWTVSPDGHTLTGALYQGGTLLAASALTVTLGGTLSAAAGATATPTVTVNLGSAFPEATAILSQISLTGVKVVATDTDLDTVTGSVAVTVQDDAPSISNIQDAILPNLSNTTVHGTWAPVFGADGQNTQTAINIVLGQAPAGYSYTTAAAGTSPTGEAVTQVDVYQSGAKLYTFFEYTHYDAATGVATLYAYTVDAQATKDPLFELALNADGTYTFHLDTNSISTSTTVQFATLSPGNSAYIVEDNGVIYYPNKQGTITGNSGPYDLVIDGFSGSSAFSGSGLYGGTVFVNNGAGGGAGIGNGNLDTNETVTFTFANTQNYVSLNVGKASQTSLKENFTVTIYSADGTQHSTATFSYPTGTPLVIDAATWAAHSSDPFFAFSQLWVTNAGGTGADTKILLTEFTYDQVTVINDQTFNFNVSVTDGDGDTYTSADPLTVYLQGGTNASGGYTYNASASFETFAMSAGGDSVDATSGANDTADYSASATGVSVALALAAAATVGGGATGDTLKGIENLYGSAQGDTLTGDSNSNLLYGASGNDILTGNGGDDILIGGLGADTMTGGLGNDLFVLTPNGVPGVKDVIADYHNAGAEHDTIDLTHLFDVGVGKSVSDYVSYSATTGELRVDTTGSGNFSDPATTVAIVNSDGNTNPTGGAHPGTGSIQIIYDDATTHAQHTTTLG